MHVSVIPFNTFVLGLMFGLVVVASSIYGMSFTLNNLIAVFSMYANHRSGQPDGWLRRSIAYWLAIIGLALPPWPAVCSAAAAVPVNPLLSSWRGFLPRGWLNWASILIMIIFAGSAALEMLIGFGCFNFLETLP